MAEKSQSLGPASLEFEALGYNVRLEPTDYGCDLFLAGRYWDTIESENKKTKAYWLGKAVTYFFERNL